MTRLYATGFVSRSDLSSSSSYAPRVFRVVFADGSFSFSDEESVSFRFGDVVAARAANAAVSTDKRLRLPETPRADGADKDGADGADGAENSRRVFFFPLRLRGASSRLRTEAFFSCAEVATPFLDAGVGAEVATPFSWARLRMRIGVLGEGVGRGDENETGAFSSAEVKAAEETRASPAAATRVRRLRAGDGGGAGGGEASPLRLKRGDWRVPVPDRARDVPKRFTRFNCSARPASAAAAPPTLLCGELKKASSGRGSSARGDVSGDRSRAERRGSEGLRAESSWNTGRAPAVAGAGGRVLGRRILEGVTRAAESVARHAR